MTRLDKKRDELADVYGKKTVSEDRPLTGDPINIAHDFKAGFDAASEEWRKIVEPLVRALELVHEISNSDEFVSVFQVSQIHGMPYRGKQYGAQVDEALEQYRAATEGE